MGISASEAGNTRFAGTETSYDAVHVDAYAARVAASLAAHEKALEEAEAEISRLEHALDVAHAVAVHDAGQPVPPRQEVARTVLGQALVAAGAAPKPVQLSPQQHSPGRSEGTSTTAVFDIEAWVEERRVQDEGSDRAIASEEEIRRLKAKANAFAAEAAVARHLHRKRLTESARNEAESAITVHLEAAGDEAALVLEQSLAEADRIVEEANRTAAERTRAAELELAALNRRMTQLRIAISQAGSSLDALTGVEPDHAANGGATVDLAGTDEPGAVDLELHAVDDDPDDRNFYERRLAGLRERLENR